MRKMFAAVAGLLVMSSPALADATYTGTRMVGDTTAYITLTTDGNTGSLHREDIVSFTVNFSDGSSISGISNNVSTSGDALIASTAEIGFNFDYPGGYFALVGQDARVRNSLWCVQIGFGCVTSGTGEVINTYDGFGQDQFDARRGFVSLLTLQSTVQNAVPEPSTWALMLLGFLGLALTAPSSRWSRGWRGAPEPA